MDSEEKVWEILLSADKKDYERICAEYGLTDFRGMLKRLSEMKKEREEEIAAVFGLFSSSFIQPQAHSSKNVSASVYVSLFHCLLHAVCLILCKQNC